MNQVLERFASFVRNIRGLVALAFAFVAFGAWADSANPKITDVTAKQRYPWNGKVDISYTASDVAAAAEAQDVDASLKVMAIDRSTTPWTTNVADAACLFVGPRATEKLTDAVATSDGAHKIVWDVDAQGLTFTSTNVIFAVLGEGKDRGVQLWKDGPYWAKCNVGATNPEERGYYFWWGDTVGYKRNAANNGWDAVDGSATGFSFDTSNTEIVTYGKEVEAMKTAGYIDASGNLVAAYDAATAHLGAQWRMPTSEEMQALLANCTTTWVTKWNGTKINGRLVTGKGEYASKSIFFPAAGNASDSILGNDNANGFYWSSTANSKNWSRFFRVIQQDEYCTVSNDGMTYVGRSVRPVRVSAK